MTTPATETSVWVTVDLYDATDPWSPAAVSNPIRQLVNRTKYLYDALSSGITLPTDAQYVVLSASGSLSAERVLTSGTGISIADGGANGAVTVSAAPWTALTPTTDYTTTPASALTLTMATDQVGTIRQGMPIRWLSSAGVLSNNTIVA